MAPAVTDNQHPVQSRFWRYTALNVGWPALCVALGILSSRVDALRPVLRTPAMVGMLVWVIVSPFLAYAALKDARRAGSVAGRVLSLAGLVVWVLVAFLVLGMWV